MKYTINDFNDSSLPATETMNLFYELSMHLFRKYFEKPILPLLDLEEDKPLHLIYILGRDVYICQGQGEGSSTENYPCAKDITEELKQLEQNGFIKKVGDPNQNWFNITNKGRRYIRSVL